MKAAIVFFVWILLTVNKTSWSFHHLILGSNVYSNNRANRGDSLAGFSPTRPCDYFVMKFLQRMRNFKCAFEPSASRICSAFKSQNSLSMSLKSSAMNCENIYQEYFHYRRTQLQPCNGTALIDVRSRKDFESGHLLGSTSIPIDELPQRLYELPPPFDEPVGIFASDKSQLEAARQVLEKHRWNINREILSSDSGSFVTGLSSRPVWKPNELLFSFLNSERGRAWYSNRDSGVALDIGCGAGRDAVLMARTLGPGWRIIGVDNDAGIFLPSQCFLCTPQSPENLVAQELCAAWRRLRPGRASA